MRIVILPAMVLCLVLLSCGKPTLSLPETIVTDLTITGTTTPATVARNQPIVPLVNMTGPNQCYRFSHFELATLNPLLFEIRAKATIPNPDRGTVICAPSAYTKDTVLSVPTHLAGKHVLRFYNGAQLFKVDTVTIN